MSELIKITPDMKRQFRSETTEHLNNLEKMLMIIEKNHENQDALHSAFRSIHSIKGNSTYLDIKDINHLSHDLEDLMDNLRSGQVLNYEDVIGLLFQGLDLLKDMNRRITDEEYAESDISEIQSKIQMAKSLAGNESAEKKREESVSELLPDMFRQEIMVDVETIDKFMNQVSELAIAKNVLNYLAEMIISGDQVSERSEELGKVSANINKISNNLQIDVMHLRLVKINTLFERLPRIVRDLSQKSEKKIELFLEGGETEIDCKTIEQMVDPLVHLIRNSVDHGIETPAERVKQGKSESGLIKVIASEEAHYAVIEVMDDGRGIDHNTIRQKALKKSFISEKELISMTENEIINLIFMPGFSTRSKTTAVSGRGVGLDIVKNNIGTLNGSVSIDCDQDIGTRIKLKIPVFMSVTDVLITETAGRKYAFPFSSILKSIKVKTKQIHGRGTRQFILFNGTVIFIKHLGKILGIRKKGINYDLRQKNISSENKISDEELYVIIMTAEDRTWGVVVDNILKRDNILIKPLERYFAGIRELSGAALLGDGSIALVIDPIKTL
ncbi:chemotaxis protein CheA [Desulfobacterales bacterium HSG16]|nr:chemotaxis protein CheA [Desulfobacterales bacterium HSG16]